MASDEDRAYAPHEHLEKTLRTGRVYPAGRFAKITNAEVVDAPEQVADALGVERGSPVIRRDRITYRDEGVPASASTSWLPGELAEVAPRLLKADRIAEGAFTYAAEKLGREVASWQDMFVPAVTTSDEAELLGVTPGSPVLRGRNWFYDSTGQVIEYGESISVGWVQYKGDL